MHLEKVVKDAENAPGDLKGLVRMLVFLADAKSTAPKELFGSRLRAFVNLVIRAHNKSGAVSEEEFGHVVRALVPINKTYASTLAHNKILSP